MVLVKILQRKDASSIIVALVLASIVSMFLLAVSQDFAQIFASEDQKFDGPGWQDQYVVPAAAAIIQFVLFEVLVRGFIAAREAYVRRSK